MVRRSSYRLGRRLKSGAKARLDYITYLNTQGIATRSPGIPDARVLMRASFAGGGEIEAVIGAIAHELGAVFDGGGEARGNIFPPVIMRARFDGGGLVDAAIEGIPKIMGAIMGGGGEFTAAMQPTHTFRAIFDGGGELILSDGPITRLLAANFDAGGLMEGNIFPPVILRASFDGGGSMSATNGGVPKIMGAVFVAGGVMVADIRAPVTMGAVFEGGGSVSASVPAPVYMGAVIEGGGAMVGDIAEPPEPSNAEFISATSVTSSASGYTQNPPAGVNVGDLLVLCVFSTQEAIGTISGWSAITEVSSGSPGSGVRQRVFTRVATGSDTAAIADAGVLNASCMLCFRNADTVTQVATGVASASGAVSQQWNQNVAYVTGEMTMQVYGLGGQIASPVITDAGADFVSETIRADLVNTPLAFNVVVATAVADDTGTFNSPRLSWTNSVPNRTGQAFSVT